MRRWTYSYRTSDGRRHTAEIEAESRDAAFARLRTELGIKPIKVTEGEGESRQDGGSPYGRNKRDRSRGMLWGAAILAAAILAVAFGAWWWLGGRGKTVKQMAARVDGSARVNARPPLGGTAREDTRPDGAPVASYRVIDPKKLEGYSAAYREIAVEVDAACEAYREASARIDFELLANYALVERIRDMAEFRAIIAHGREVVSAARDAVRRSVEAHYEDIPSSNEDDRNEAQRLYGLVMEELDATDERLESDECALSLLETNRGKWRVVKGIVIWDDPKLERQFRIFGREQSTSKSRWERDFGPTGSKPIESKPVELPIRK